MRLTFHGAARTVTGSQHLVEVNGKRILLDCGLYQGRRTEAAQRNRTLPFDARAIDLMILSHAHIDHSGNIPNLVKSGYDGDILCTHATRDLCATMLMDSAHIQEKDAQFVNKRHKDDAPVAPIYTQDDARASLRQFTSQDYGRARTVLPGVSVTFFDAGHMLGSAFVVLDIEDHDAKRDVRLVFSGDLGRAGTPIIRDPQPIDGADVLIMESTYGDMLHPPFADEKGALERIIGETVKRGGMVLIPAFAVGRTQQVVYTLHQLARAGDLPDVPIYVDSPLAIDVTAVYRTHPECYDDEIRAFVNGLSADKDPFGFGRLQYTRGTDESKKLNFLTTPAVIIAASGMMEAGRILHHLKNRIDDPRTTILVVGYQAENTLGRKLVDGEREVRIFGESYANRARVEVLSGFSGHADQADLLAWVGGMKRKPRQTFLVHGEGAAQMILARELHAQHGIAVSIPERGQSFEV
jgi:metallo-beta-lactamase family protein